MSLDTPIDGGLWDGIEAEFRERKEITDLTHCVRTIRAIGDYDCYSRIIQGCRIIARERGCKLIEVEQFWDSGDRSGVESASG